MLATNQNEYQFPADLILSSGEVHVWCTTLDLSMQQIGVLEQNLSPNELARANRFFLKNDRHRFTAAHGILRNILGGYLGMASNQIRFAYGDYGKPALAADLNQENLNFNLSHSDGLALFAFTHGRDIGIDLERVQEDLGLEQIAARFFSERENLELRLLSSNQGIAAFFNCWARKEAYIKARGGGFSVGLDQFDVSLAPDKPAELLCTRDDPTEASRWTMREIILKPGYAGALVVEGDGWQLSFREWQNEIC